jgi:hypothetical protein
LDFSLVDFELHDALALLIVDGQTTSEIEGLEVLLRAEILRWPISWTRCCATLRELTDTVATAPLGSETLSKEAVLTIIQRLSQTSSWPFLVDVKMPDERYVDTLENMEQDCRDEALKCPQAGDLLYHDLAVGIRLSYTRSVADVALEICNFTWSRCTTVRQRASI